MSIFKTNRDVDSTFIVIGIHILLGAVIYIEARGNHDGDLSTIMTNLIIIYGMICSYFFKSQKEQNGNPGGNTE